MLYRSDSPKATKLPFPMTLEQAADFAAGWLEHADYGSEPNHDTRKTCATDRRCSARKKSLAHIGKDGNRLMSMYSTAPGITRNQSPNAKGSGAGTASVGLPG